VHVQDNHVIADAKAPGSIARHTRNINWFRGDTSRLNQRGISYDVTGTQGARLEPDNVVKVVRDIADRI
jgi:hypothetical protein